MIPTPSPDPDDFVAEIDNPLLPLEPGSVWTYRPSATGPGRRTVTATVLGETREVAGLTATVVREVTTDAGGRPVLRHEDWYAQDRGGNVWYVGRDGAWEAGAGGAEAGLAMPAAPRVGDSYRRAAGPRTAAPVVTVLDVDARVSVPAGELGGVVSVEVDDEPAGGTSEEYYAPGIGLVLVEDRVGDGLELVAFVDG